MRKSIKIMLIVIMVLGILLSISNFVSVDLKAGGDKDGTCNYINGTFKCMGDGSECASDRDCSAIEPND